MRHIMRFVALVALPLVSSCDSESKLEAQFLACLEETGSDEQACLNKLGPAAWMPEDETVCEAVASRIGAIIEAGGLARYPDLFRNERCARLGRPHNQLAAATGSPYSIDRTFVECYNRNPNGILMDCSDIVGTHKWYPVTDKECPALTRMIAKYETDPLDRSWDILFHNERCRRLRRDYYRFEN